MSCWEVADMVIADGARWTVRHDAAADEVPGGWNLWSHRFEDGIRGGADLVQAFGEDRGAAIAAAHGHGWRSQYADFLANKRVAAQTSGFSVLPDALNPTLFLWQREIVSWALAKGRAALFEDCGLGKTPQQLEWAYWVCKQTQGNALILTPLAVSAQTRREGVKFGIPITICREADDVRPGINVTNYERGHLFEPRDFAGVVLDESSILKAQDGKTRRALIESWRATPYRLCCTATPAPNDFIELGNHAEFLGICRMAEMLAMFFVNANRQQAFVLDGRTYETKGSNKGGTEWRLKHHAEGAFFRWLATWAVAVGKPSDLGHEDDGFVLPPLTVRQAAIESSFVPAGQMVFTGLRGVGHRAQVRRETVADRLTILRDLVARDGGDWVVWCGLDAEQDAVAAALGSDCVSVYGSLAMDEKEARIERWLRGEVRHLVSKPSICGLGLNLQRAHQMAFFGLNDSWETYYQAIRRQWRYGQAEPVSVWIIMSDLEEPVYRNVMRKEALASRLRAGLVQSMNQREEPEVGEVLETADAAGEHWRLLLGDSSERLREIEDASVDLSVYSPPFADLFTYSNSNRDLGNSRDWPEFFAHYSFIIREVLRVTKPGRMTCVHTSDIPAMQSRDGWIGVKDFPGEVIRAYEREGWAFVGRAFIQKNPQAQAIRVKSKALLFVQLRKDSADSRPALVDQVLLFRRPGENAVPVRPVENGEMDNETWIEWANGIWLGISESDTLQYSRARDKDDEKHICPLQLGTIERCVKLYSNPGEVVLSPFVGIGSEGYEAVRLGRRFVGIELKRSYWAVAAENLRRAEAVRGHDLFAWADRQEDGFGDVQLGYKAHSVVSL